jgi:hypothetical protein
MTDLAIAASPPFGSQTAYYGLLPCDTGGSDGPSYSRPFAIHKYIAQKPQAFGNVKMSLEEQGAFAMTKLPIDVSIDLDSATAMALFFTASEIFRRGSSLTASINLSYRSIGPLVGHETTISSDLASISSPEHDGSSPWLAWQLLGQRLRWRASSPVPVSEHRKLCNPPGKTGF